MTEENQNNDFALTNEKPEDWEKAQFWESDPMQNNQSLQGIYLYVDWEQRTADVETVMQTNSTPGRVWHGLDGMYKLPEDTDFSEFPEFFRDEVQPMLQKIGAGFEAEWDGSNWKGRFTEEAHDMLWDLDQLLQRALTHDMQYFFSLRDLYEYGGVEQMKQDLKEYDGIDLLTADLDNEEIQEKVIETLTGDDGVVYKLIQVDIIEELKEIQEAIKEEEE